MSVFGALDAKHIIMVLSGKGGVGKSTVACQLAMMLAQQEVGEEVREGGGGPNEEGKKTTRKPRVGILDVDICGPSVPKICGVEGANVTQNKATGLWTPVAVPGFSSLHVMSIAYLLPKETDAVVWRGPRKDALIKQFITHVDWGALDFLIIDTPPGTSDEHMTLCEALSILDPTGAVVVTTPQLVSTDDVRKELNFCYKLKIRCVGIVENMSGYVCPHCKGCTNIFSKGGGKVLAEQYQVPFLGELPIDPHISWAEDLGKQCYSSSNDDAKAEEEEEEPEGKVALRNVVTAVMEQVKRVEVWKNEEAEEGKEE